MPIPTPSTPSRRAAGAALVLVAVAAAWLACRGGPAEGPSGAEYVDTGDLPALRERGKLRILMPVERPEMLRERSFPLTLDRQLAERFATKLDLEPVIVRRETRRELVAALEAGAGDLVVARLRVTPELAERFAFSIPVDHVRELVVVAGDAEIESPADLAGVRVAVPTDTPYVESLERLRLEVPDLEIVEVSGRTDEGLLLEAVADGTFEATVAEEDLLEILLADREDLRVAFPLTRNRPVAWALRPGATALKAALDDLLHASALASELPERLEGDLDAIRERGILRILTRNNSATYFLYRGEQMGFEYELARRFARHLGVRLQVVVPREPGRLVDALLEGRGDLVAASLLVTPERRERVRFTRPYARASQLLVKRTGTAGPESPAELAGHRIHLQQTDPTWPRLERLAAEIGFELVELPEAMESEERVEAVARGEIDLTVVDSHMLDIDLTYRDDVESAFALGEPAEIAWATRPGDAALHQAADAFLAAQKGTTDFNVLRNRYFRNRDEIARTSRARLRGGGTLTPFDPLLRRHARRREIDWRLLAAQAFQESRFDPTVRSWAGAVGLMQVMPRTARHMGVEGDLRDPEVSVRAGSRYLRWLLDSFPTSLPYAERLRFALAAYNAGRGHVQDGRRLARQRGRDPDVWFGEVEEVLPLLAHSEVARHARYGYCRCSETVRYVREIQDRYEAYLQVLELAGEPRGPVEGVR